VKKLLFLFISVFLFSRSFDLNLNNLRAKRGLDFASLGKENSTFIPGFQIPQYDSDFSDGESSGWSDSEVESDVEGSDIVGSEDDSVAYSSEEDKLKNRLTAELNENNFLDDSTIRIFTRALQEIHESNMNKSCFESPQKRVPYFFERVYALLTGIDSRNVIHSPIRPDRQKIEKIMNIHRSILAHLKINGVGSDVFKLINNGLFRDYLQEQDCEVALVDVVHMFDGDEDGGGHTYKQINEDFLRKYRVFINLDNEVTYASLSVGENESSSMKKRKVSKGDHCKSIFPNGLEDCEIFSAVRCAKSFLCRQDNRVLLEFNKKFFMEMYLQQEDGVVKSAFPIFSFINLSDFKRGQNITLYKLKECTNSDIVELNISYDELIDKIESLLKNIIEKSGIRRNGDEESVLRYFRGDSFIVDVASCFNNGQIPIKSGIYVQVPTDALDPEIVNRINGTILRHRSSDNLESPFSPRDFCNKVAASSCSDII
jgi:hypothetical protein